MVAEMKARIYKLFEHWVCEFPFATVVYCPDWQSAIDALHDHEAYLLEHE